MRGQEQLLEMRRRGFVPSWVFIDTDPDVTNDWRDWEVHHEARAALLIEPKDRRPDMRCVTALPCFVQGSDRKRVFAVRDACILIGAKRVIAAVTVSRLSEFRTIEITDTDGIEDYVETAAEVEHG